MTRAYEFSPRIQVRMLNDFSYVEVAPLLDELNEKWVYVDSTRTSFNPPAAGALETLVTIVIGTEASQAIWNLFFSEITKEAGHRIQSKLLDLINRGLSKPNRETHPPMSIICGKVRLYFIDNLTIQQLHNAMVAAKNLGESLAPEKFLGDDSVGSPDSYFTYFWDVESNTWLPDRPRDKK